MTIGETLAAAETRLRAAGIDSPGREARVLLSLASGLATGAIIGWPERTLDEPAAETFRSAVKRRAAREPVSRIFGRREFWSLEFAISPATLDPRPDSETLVEAALVLIPDREAPLRLLDLGTGSGCLLLALLSELPNATGLGIDRSEATAAVARENAERLGLDLRTEIAVRDWADMAAGRFDLALSNPPYIASTDLAMLDPEVRLHDPAGALDGGFDGLDAYRSLAEVMPRVIAPQGHCVIELGTGQEQPVAGIFRSAGLEITTIRPDLAGIPRALVARIGDQRK